MNDAYAEYDKFSVATDCIVFGFDGTLKLLVFDRRVAPFKGALSLIGSFVSINENLEEAAKRVLKEITGLEDIYMEQLHTYGSVDRDPGGRCITIAQYALVRIEEQDKDLVEKHGAKWYDYQMLPPLVLDHDLLVADALSKLRERAKSKPIGFELLREKFTLPDLQNLYEAIYQNKLDTRNFRKKILSFGILKKLDEKDYANSKKGAFLYQFDEQRYKSLCQEGFNFDL